MAGRFRISSIFFCLILLARVAIGQAAQAKPQFEVATIKPSAPLDMAKLAAEVRAGQMPQLGAHIDPDQAHYTYMTLRQLIELAYGLKPGQVKGPDWLGTERFDIVAKIPDGVSKDAAPQMLQSLLENRFKLAAHRETKDQPVLALITGKGGPKMKEAQPPQTLDPNAPLKPGETQMDTTGGPARMSIDMSTGQTTVNMGSRGTIMYALNRANDAMELEAHGVSMSGLADMLSRFSQAQGAGRQIVDMTGLTGNYDFTLDFPISDLLNMARSAGMLPPGAGPTSPTNEASTPSGTSSLNESVEALGLKLEPRNAPVELLVIDHMEKTPTEN
jgi:uncharacterized protein (TIGR03435 family)